MMWVAGVALAGSLIPLEEAHATFPAEQNGSLAFEGTVVNPDGTGRTEVTASDSSYDPAWSADGAKLAYVHSTGGGNELRVVTTDGSDDVIFTTTGPLASPSWSPDGTQLVFERIALWRIQADGSGLSRLSGSLDIDMSPAWSPGGSRIAFQRGSDIYMMSPQGESLTQLTQACFFDSEYQQNRCDGEHSYGSPNWHPDGTSLLVQVGSGANEAWRSWLGRIPASGIGRGEMPVVVASRAKPHHVGPGAYSPDGRFVAYSAFDETAPHHSDEIWVTRLSDGARTARIPFASSPDWQPCPTGTCPQFPVDEEPDVDDCELVSREVGAGGPHRVSVSLPSGAAVDVCPTQRHRSAFD
jgi:hypothetical protein